MPGAYSVARLNKQDTLLISPAMCRNARPTPFIDPLAQGLAAVLTFAPRSGTLTTEVALNRAALAEAIHAGRLEWQRHAFERMVEREIARVEVHAALLRGEIIEDYPDDRPFPSALFFHMSDRMPVHVVAAYDAQAQWVFIITAYRPDRSHFEADFKTRRHT